MRHGEHGKRRLLRDGGSREVAGRPDFVVVVKGGRPCVGKLRQFPSEIADIIFVGAEGGTVVVVKIAGGGRINMDDIYVMGIIGLEARDVGPFALAVFAVELEWDEGGGDTSGIGCADHAAGGFTDAKVGGEKAGNVESELGVRTGEGGRTGRMADGEIVDEFAVGGGDADEAELAVFVLRAEALERSESGDAAEPREGVSDGGAGEAEGER